jgi:hypothetical protein
VRDEAVSADDVVFRRVESCSRHLVFGYWRRDK